MRKPSRRRNPAYRKQIDAEIEQRLAMGDAPKEIAAALNEENHYVYKRIRMMGLTQPPRHPKKPRTTSAFNGCGFYNDGRSTGRRHLGIEAMSVAIHWFIQRGYGVSLPIRVEAYDLIADSPRGPQRIQVKFTSNAGKQHYVALVCHYVFVRNETGKRCRKAVPYKASEIDGFFIQTADNDMYLIPVEAVKGKTAIVLNAEFGKYLLPKLLEAERQPPMPPYENHLVNEIDTLEDKIMDKLKQHLDVSEIAKDLGMTASSVHAEINRMKGESPSVN